MGKKLTLTEKVNKIESLMPGLRELLDRYKLDRLIDLEYLTIEDVPHAVGLWTSESRSNQFVSFYVLKDGETIKCGEDSLQKEIPELKNCNRDYSKLLFLEFYGRLGIVVDLK